MSGGFSKLHAMVAAAVCVLPVGAAHAAQSIASLPGHFAGEALTVALAFSAPALAAGAYLGLHRLNARLGARTIVALTLTVMAAGALAYFVEDASAMLQRAGLASLTR